MVDSNQVRNDVLEILRISDEVVDKTEAFKVDPKNYREYRISVLSVAKLVQDEYNHHKLMEKANDRMDKLEEMISKQVK